MMRIGQGYDLHRLEAGRPLILGGIAIEFEKGLAGHSDADVLCHAITDALLGAAGLGDIGQMFPETDPAYFGADSTELLRAAYERVGQAGFRLVNLDSTVVAQRPRLAPHIPSMRQCLAECLRIDPARVSIKAKTNELVGPEGRGEAISAQAVALLEER